MAVCFCRWPNGEFSIVSAYTKADAIALLDEWGNAEQAQISLMRDCMFDFRRADDGEIELTQIGEVTNDLIMKKGYPVLDEALSDADFDEKGGYTEASRKAIRAAVGQERKHLRNSQPEPKSADTGLGHEIQERMDVPSVVVNLLVKKVAEEILDAEDLKGRKPS